MAFATEPLAPQRQTQKSPQVMVAVLLFVLSFILVWVAAVYADVLGDAAYGLPLCVGAAASGVAIWFSAVRLERRALLSLLIFTVVFLNITFQARVIGGTGLNPQNGVKIAIWLVLLGTAGLNWRRFADLLSDPVIALFAAFMIFALISATWSPVPTYTTACSIGLLAYLGFACLIAREFDERTLYVTLVWALAAYMAANWIAAALIPGFAFVRPYGDGDIYRLQGISGNPNGLGKQAAVFFLLVCVVSQRRYLSRGSIFVLGTLGMVTLVATNSRTALIGALVAWSFVQLRTRLLLLPVFVAAVAMVIVLTFASAMGALPDFNELAGFVSRTSHASEVMTLTGRTEIWSAVWEKILEQPLLGHGYNAYEAVMSSELFGAKDAATEAHNTVLQALFTVGFVGAAPLLAALAVLVYRGITRPNPARDMFTCYLLVSGLAEAEIVSIPELLTLVALLVFAYDAIGRRNRAGSWLQPSR